MNESLAATIAAIAPLDDQAMQAAAARQEQLTKPHGALGRLETLSVQLAGITGCARPRLNRRALVVAAASHGVAQEGVSAYPASVTAQMVHNFLAGGAAINVLADQAGAELVLVDAGVDPPLPAHPHLRSAALAHGTRNLRRERAMPQAHAEQMLLAGVTLAHELADQGVQLLGVGEMGIGNTTAAAALVAAATGTSVEQVTGRGTQIDDEQLRHKQTVIGKALALHRPNAHDGLDLLSAVGGYEIGLLAGCCLGAAARRVPVVLDGYITAAAALIALRLTPTVQPYLIAAHRSAEPGHAVALKALSLEPLLDLGLRLGEGSGAALAMPLVVAAARTLDAMATFGEAAVDNKEITTETRKHRGT